MCAWKWGWGLKTERHGSGCWGFENAQLWLRSSQIWRNMLEVIKAELESFTQHNWNKVELWHRREWPCPQTTYPTLILATFVQLLANSNLEDRVSFELSAWTSCHLFPTTYFQILHLRFTSGTSRWNLCQCQNRASTDRQFVEFWSFGKGIIGRPWVLFILIYTCWTSKNGEAKMFWSVRLDCTPRTKGTPAITDRRI